MIHKYSRVSGVASILAEDEEPPYELINIEGRSPIVITCDHASNRIPRSLDNLGLPASSLREHIAWDIGCAALSRRLSALMNAPAILGGFSRLVVDLNRHLNDPSSIPEISDNTPVPGNQGIDRTHAAQRVEEIFLPYHTALSALLAEVHATQGVPVILSLHSFTPRWANFERPWHVGVLWNRDGRIAHPLIKNLRHNPDLCVGDNQPYHAREPVGYGMDVHAEGNGYPHALLEIRQDLLSTPEGIDHWANLLFDALSDVLNDKSIYQQVEFES
ncbi:MAG: N-formylglutamate amidohydrolase [marine bacterium B5-7]|nr:MAG: N-formylglutamate amidohydrolase [marine bacterium B5-7]